MFYILDDEGNPKPEPSLMKWAEWMGKADRRVARTQAQDILVSTIFLGVDHGHLSEPPVLWETMAFYPDGFTEECRYSCLQDAIEGHELMVARVFTNQSHAN